MKEQELTGIPRNPDGTYPAGVSGNPNGRPADTMERRIERKALKVIIDEYRESLSDVLPEISPILKDMARAKDIHAIKEIHDRVMGKSQQNVDVMSGGEKIQFAVVSYKDED